jgi:hypothetical protein
MCPSPQAITGRRMISPVIGQMKSGLMDAMVAYIAYAFH